MAISPVCAVPQASAQGKHIELQGSPTGRSLLHKFEQASNPTMTTTDSLTVDTNVNSEKIEAIVSPTCVMNLSGVTTPTKDQEANTPPESPEREAPIVKAVQYDYNVDSVTHLPDIKLNVFLRRTLTQAQLNRISFYGAVIHDINKEASEMASNDTSNFVQENPNLALIDEEHWLITAIASRSQEETKGLQSTCPSSFAEAIGETDPDSSNPLSNLNSSRTQLWKPSRSWWEARSGKNPWIEPRSHNKRWRYLWPIIHYHKFLARCIKKLKRNSVDVHNSRSPVCLFLRDEVCAVSGHLAEVSKFTAEEWLESLSTFEGWIDSTQESNLRELVKMQKLRSLAEPTDFESTLLKDQIDEQFLRAMENARLNMEGENKYLGHAGEEDLLRPISECNTSNNNMHNTNPRFVVNNRFKNSMMKPKRRMNSSNTQENSYRNSSFHFSHPEQSVNQPLFYQDMHLARNQGVYPRPPIARESMHGHFFPMQQPTQPNMQSANQPYYPHQYGHLAAGGYYQNMPFPSMHGPSNYPNENYVFGPHYNCIGSPVGHNPPFSVPYTSPAVMNTQNADFSNPMGVSQPSPAHDMGLQNASSIPQSPYWGHLDPMAGIVTPQNTSLSRQDSQEEKDQIMKTPNHNGKPPFVNSTLPHNFNFHQFNRNFVPPSPASQFLMTQTPQASGFFHNAINMASHAGSSDPACSSPQKDAEPVEIGATMSLSTPQVSKKVPDSEAADHKETQSMN